MTTKPVRPDPAKRGRPRAADPGSAVMTWMRASEYDQVITLARKQGITVSRLMRQLVKASLT
jgi:hypothetical protein